MEDSSQNHGHPSLGRQENQHGVKTDGEQDILPDDPKSLSGETDDRRDFPQFIGH